MNNKRFAIGSKNIRKKVDAIQKKRTKSIFSGIKNKEDLWKVDKFYDYLIDNDLIDYESTDKEVFAKILFKEPSESAIVLKMDNPTAR